MTRLFAEPTSVVVFCGGHGAQTLSAALLDEPAVHLTLLVNGYDNGLSTGVLRAMVPGMLGVSDFRKNLLPGLADGDAHDEALRAVLEHRLSAQAGPWELAAVQADLAGRWRGAGEGGWCRTEHLTDAERVTIGAALDAFEAHCEARATRFSYADCALANLVMAGLYLSCDQDFNRALTAFTQLFGSRAQLHNVTSGENAWLVALKEDGELLVDESAIVGPQSQARICDVALVPEPFDPAASELALLDREQRAAWLHAREVHPAIDPAAAAALEAADLVVYAAGTQHSSLIPSYLTAGLAESLQRSRARATVLLINIATDYDIAGWHAVDVLDAALAALGDPGNERGSVTHVLHHEGRREAAGAPAVPDWVRRTERPRNCRWIGADLEDGVHSGVHHGPRTAAVLARLYDEAVGQSLGAVRRDGDGESAEDPA